LSNGQSASKIGAEDAMRTAVTEDIAVPDPPLAAASRAARPVRSRWWWAVALGVALAIPFGWLLSHAAQLPFYLGLFFFVLFGLLIGAVMFRVSAPRRPYGLPSLTVGSALVILVAFVLSIFVESRDFPTTIAKRAGEQARVMREMSIYAYRTQIAEGVRTYLGERFPPGGTIGYVRWALTKGVLEPADVPGLTGALHPRQGRVGWGIRVVLSIVLLCFGLGSQTFPLHLRDEPDPRVISRRRSKPDPEGHE
jgi:hypothetical protein